MTFETALIFIVSLILLWIKPGPGKAAIITRALNDGFFAGWCVAMGIVTGGVIFFLLTAFGIAFINDHVEQINIIFKIIGSSYLFYIGYQGLKNIGSGQWKGRQDNKSKKEIFKNYMTGLLITMANPFAIFFFIGIMPMLVPLGELTIKDIIIGAVIVAYVGFLVDSIIAGLASQVRETLSNTTFIRNINLITSIGFILIGAFLIFSLITDFDGAFAL